MNSRLRRGQSWSLTLPNLLVLAVGAMLVFKTVSLVSSWISNTIDDSNFRMPEPGTVVIGGGARPARLSPAAGSPAKSPPAGVGREGVVNNVAPGSGGGNKNGTEDASRGPWAAADSTVVWNEYVALHNRLTSSPRPEEHRFAILAPTGGFGARLVEAASTMLFAVLTDRAVILRGWSGTDEFMRLPFQLYLEDKIEEHHKSRSTKQLQEHDWCRHFDGSHDKDRGAVSWRLDDYNQVFPQRAVSIETNCPLYRWMTRNALYGRRIESIFGRPPDGLTGFDILGYLLRRFTLAPPTRLKFDKLLAEFRGPTRDRLIVGVQLRTTVSDLQRDAPSLNERDVEHMLACAEHVTQGAENVVFFVAADSAVAIEQCRTRLGDRLRVVDGSHEAPTLEKLVLDSYLLSSADVLLITAGSLFGSTAAARSGRPPLVVGPGSSQCTVADLKASPHSDPADGASPAAVW